MSCQPRPHPHASGTAAISASRGTATNTATRTRSKTLDRSGMISCLAAVRGLNSAPVRGAGASVVVVMRSSLAGRGRSPWADCSASTRVRDQHDYAYVDVAYATVGSSLASLPRAGVSNRVSEVDIAALEMSWSISYPGKRRVLFEVLLRTKVAGSR